MNYKGLRAFYHEGLEVNEERSASLDFWVFSF
jgi:hypothetical protein